MSKKKVEGSGPLDADIMIIGEAPGKTEVRKGEPFVGKTGKLLRKFLKQVGIVPSQCRIDNVMQVRPSGNKFGKFYHDSKRQKPKEELLEARSALKERIQRVSPNVILLVGGEALKAVTGKQGITKWRGSLLNTKYGKAIPTFHPSYIVRMYKHSGLMKLDLAKVQEEAKSPKFVEPYQSHNVRTVGSDRALRLLKEVQDGKIIIDLETIRGTDIVTHFGFCTDRNHAYSLPLTQKISERQETKLWVQIARILGDPEIGVICQNAIFDLVVLARLGFPTNNIAMDTMLAQHLCYPELPKDLDTLTSIYTNLPYYAEMKHSDKGVYNALDCLATFRCAEELEKELLSIGTHKVFYEFVMPALRTAINMQMRGLRVDKEWREKEKESLQERERELQEQLNTIALGKLEPKLVQLREVAEQLKKEEAEEELENLLERIGKLNKLIEKIEDDKLNVNSHKWFPYYLYDKDCANLPTRTRRGTDKVTTNENAIHQLGKHHDAPELQLTIKLRSLSKLIGTYYEQELDPDGRFRCTWKLGGAVTGRWSSSKTYRETGGNLQNVPEGERRMFVPDGDKVFVYSDLAQADARVVAWDSKDPFYKGAFERGEDVHIVVAKKLFEGEITKDLRFAAKTVEHAANYGTGPRTYSQSLYKNVKGRTIKKSIRDPSISVDLTERPLSQNEAKARLQTYYKEFPKIKPWHKEIEQIVRKERRLETPLGRVRYFFDRINSTTVRQAINYRPQSTVMDIINRVCYCIEVALPKGADLLAQTHDAVLVQCEEKQVPLVKQVIENASKIVIFQDLIIPMDHEVGDNWRDVE